MRIGDMIFRIYSNVIEENYNNLRRDDLSLAPWYENYEIEPLPGSGRYAYRKKGLEPGKWFLPPVWPECARWFEVNLFELALPDNEKFDTIEDLRESYEN